MLAIWAKWRARLWRDPFGIANQIMLLAIFYQNSLALTAKKFSWDAL